MLSPSQRILEARSGHFRELSGEFRELSGGVWAGFRGLIRWVTSAQVRRTHQTMCCMVPVGGMCGTPKHAFCDPFMTEKEQFLGAGQSSPCSLPPSPFNVPLLFGSIYDIYTFRGVGKVSQTQNSMDLSQVSLIRGPVKGLMGHIQN